MSIMHLRLSLPPRAETPSAEIQTRPADVERWIRELPILNINETIQLISRQLVGLNRQALDDRTRLQLLELYRAPVKHISRELHNSYISLSPPLPDKARLAAQQVRELQTEMAYGYKQIAVNSTALAKPDHTQQQLLAVALHRAIRYLTEVLFRCYELYGPPPQDTWFEIHQLYRYAELLGLTETPLSDPMNTALAQVSISHAYKQALLLDFSDPYHLPALILARIYRYLDRYASLAQISPGIASLRSQCQFLINLDSDRAGAVNAETSPITTEVRYRLLNTTELARVAHQQLGSLQSGQQPNPDGLEKDFFANLGQDMLQRLINAWGINPKRVFTRQLHDNQKIDVAFGIKAINYFVNNTQPFVPSTNDVGPQPRRTAIGVTEGSPNKVRQAPAPDHSTWLLTDESAGGYSLASTGNHSEPVRVGDLLASNPGSGHWEIGVVRWVRTSGTEDMELGVQRLSPGAAAVALLPLEGDQEEFLLALSLPEVKAMRQPPSLISPRGLYRPNQLMSLDNGTRTRQIRTLKLIELSGAFERFQYEVIGA